MNSRTILVGDVHGCPEELEALLAKLDYDSRKDRLILLGDLVDRGPDSVGAVELAKDLKAELVIGNHDEKFLRYHKHAEKQRLDPKYKNPMFTEKRQALYEQLRDKHLLEYFASGVPFLRFRPGWVAVHAGVIPNNLPVEVQDPRILRILRYVDPSNLRPMSLEEDLSPPVGGVAWTQIYRGPDRVVFGHWVVEPHLKTQWTYPTDYGCVFGRELAAQVFESDNGLIDPVVVTVPAKQAYATY